VTASETARDESVARSIHLGRTHCGELLLKVICLRASMGCRVKKSVCVLLDYHTSKTVRILD
jgi:hypothetical protein